MSGVTFMFTGDFRQTLPIITKGTRTDTIRGYLKSPLWSFIETLNL